MAKAQEVVIEKKKRVKGRTKGSSYERYIAKLIIEAFTDFGITAEHCWRTPLSGGHMAASKIDPGDIQYHPKLAKLFPYSCECKSYRKINWLELFKPTAYSGERNKKGGSMIIDWWKQCRAAANNSHGKAPLLIMKQNQSLDYCVLLQKDYLNLVKLSHAHKIPMMLMMATKINGDPVRLITFSDFLQMAVAVMRLKKTKA